MVSTPILQVPVTVMCVRRGNIRIQLELLVLIVRAVITVLEELRNLVKLVHFPLRNQAAVLLVLVVLYVKVMELEPNALQEHILMGQ